jgi:hypothetical protein
MLEFSRSLSHPAMDVEAEEKCRIQPCGDYASSKDVRRTFHRTDIDDCRARGNSRCFTVFSLIDSVTCNDVVFVANANFAAVVPGCSVLYAIPP